MFNSSATSSTNDICGGSLSFTYLKKPVCNLAVGMGAGIMFLLKYQYPFIETIVSPLNDVLFCKKCKSVNNPSAPSDLKCKTFVSCWITSIRNRLCAIRALCYQDYRIR